MEAAKELGPEKRKFVRWTPELDAQLREGFAASEDNRELAAKMGLPYEAVRHRTFMLKLLRRQSPGFRQQDRWTPEMVEQLTRLWGDGFSAKRIAMQMGDGLTRMAILGKAHRLKLPPRELAVGSKRVKRKPSHYHVRTRPKLRLVVDNTPDDETPVDQRKTLMELTADTCRWPIGDPLKPDFFFCGAPSSGFSYCPKHTLRSMKGFQLLGEVASRVVSNIEAQRRDNAQES